MKGLKVLYLAQSIMRICHSHIRYRFAMAPPRISEVKEIIHVETQTLNEPSYHRILFFT